MSTSAPAGELLPGQSGGDERYHYEIGRPPVAGEVIATRMRDFEVSVVNEEGFFYQRGTFSQQVIREHETGRLAFLYAIDSTASTSGADLITLSGSGFAGVTTDVYSDAYFPPHVSRSADGDTVSVLDGEDPPSAELLVRTDALAFTDGGTAAAVIRFQGIGGGTPDQSATLATYRPVPEPAATAPLALLALSLSRRMRPRL